MVGTLDTLFQNTRRQFIDEIFFTTPCERGIVQDVLEQARIHGVDLRMVPDMYDGVAWNNPIEYIGQFPTIPLHRGEVPELGLFFKRVFDTVFSVLAFFCFRLSCWPSPSPSSSIRAGRFYTLRSASARRESSSAASSSEPWCATPRACRPRCMHMNERDDVLFKIANDPRITRARPFPAQVFA